MNFKSLVLHMFSLFRSLNNDAIQTNTLRGFFQTAAVSVGGVSTSWVGSDWVIS